MANPIERLGAGIITAGPHIIISDLSLDFIKYEVVFSGLVSTYSTDTNFAVLTSINNGSTFAESSGNYTYEVQRSSGSGDGTSVHYPSSNSDFGILINGMSNISGNFLAGTIEIFNPMNSGSRTTILCHSGGKINADGRSDNPQVQDCLVQRNSTEANNAIKIYSKTNAGSAGNFTMKYIIYGYRA